MTRAVKNKPQNLTEELRLGMVAGVLFNADFDYFDVVV